MEAVYLALGIIAGMLSGLLGVGGGWLVVPALSFLGMDMTKAVGTSLIQMIGGGTMSFISHYRYGNVRLKLALAFALPAVVGSHFGKEFGLWLSSQGIANQTLSYVYYGVLSYIILYITYVKKNPIDSQAKVTYKWPGPEMIVGDRVFPVAIPISAGFLVGCLAATIGIGGGLILVPLATYYLKLPVKTAVGSTVLSIFLGSLYSGSSYAFSGQTDLLIAGLLFAGATLGSTIGSSASRYIKPSHIEFIYLFFVVLTLVSLLLRQLTSGYVSAVLLMGAGAGFGIYIMFVWLKSLGNKAG